MLINEGSGAEGNELGVVPTLKNLRIDPERSLFNEKKIYIKNVKKELMKRNVIVGQPYGSCKKKSVKAAQVLTKPGRGCVNEGTLKPVRENERKQRCSSHCFVALIEYS